MPISPTDRVSIPDEVMVRPLGDEAVLLNLTTETYFGLNASGTRMWHALTTSNTVQEACDALATEFDVERAELEADLSAFVDELIAHGLLRASS